MAGDEFEPIKALYSSLDSTLSPAAIVELAKRPGLSSVALTGTGNLHEAVEFVESTGATETGGTIYEMPAVRAVALPKNSLKNWGHHPKKR
jgi:hypothetical protein